MTILVLLLSRQESAVVTEGHKRSRRQINSHFVAKHLLRAIDCSVLLPFVRTQDYCKRRTVKFLNPPFSWILRLFKTSVFFPQNNFTIVTSGSTMACNGEAHQVSHNKLNDDHVRKFTKRTSIPLGIMVRRKTIDESVDNWNTRRGFACELLLLFISRLA